MCLSLLALWNFYFGLRFYIPVRVLELSFFKSIKTLYNQQKCYRGANIRGSECSRGQLSRHRIILGRCVYLLAGSVIQELKN